MLISFVAGFLVCLTLLRARWRHLEDRVIAENLKAQEYHRKLLWMRDERQKILKEQSDMARELDAALNQWQKMQMDLEEARDLYNLEVERNFQREYILSGLSELQ